ncbi:RNA polymerase sigma-54 factor RpoN [Clostridiaceae bacterium JG1575]|nr:RNA polymerase sigma-54 factor RpoN [Clostridiaceae bacterium JG1575]
MELSQHQRTELHLSLTQEMLTSIGILELSGSDLLDFLVAESQSNPALDPDEALIQADRAKEALALSRIAPLLSDPTDPAFPQDEVSEGDPLLFIPSPTSLCAYLTAQLGEMPLAPQVLQSALWIVNQLDERGYFHPEDQEAAPPHYSHWTEARFAVQSLDPPGIGARDLTECLILQLRAKGHEDPILEALLREDLDALAKGAFGPLERKYGSRDFEADLLLLRSLTPKPAVGYSDGSIPQTLLPDLTFASKGDAVQVTLNHQFIPRLKVSGRYLSMLQQLEPQEQPLYQQYLRRISGILEAIEKRNETLLRIGECIAAHQREYLLSKIADPLPLTMNEVADELRMNPSTVSRAVKDKYVRLDQRIVALRFFFPLGVATAQGDKTNRSAVLKRLESLILSETKPYSDAKLAHLLSLQGVQVSRRTVTKYRELLGFPRAGVRIPPTP